MRGTSAARSTAPSAAVVYIKRAAVPHPVRQALRHHRAGRLDGLPPRELHGDLRLRQPVAPALHRRRPGPWGQVRPRQQVQPAGRGDLGARLRRDPDRAVGRDPVQVHHRLGAAGAVERLDLRRAVLAERRRRDRLDHDPHVRHGPRQVGLPRPGGGRRVARSEPPQRHGREQDAGVHLERHGFAHPPSWRTERIA